MELLYIYIEDFKNIYNQEFSFSNEYEIKYNSESSNLIINKVKEQKLDIFHKEFISIKAIIGGNGSGKTNLLLFILNFFDTDIIDDRNKYIVVLKDDNGNLLLFNRKKGNLLINNTNLRKETLYTIGNINVKIEYDKNKIRNKVDLIFYSNTFSVYQEPRIKRRFYNISLTENIRQHSILMNRMLTERVNRDRKLFKKQGNIEKFSDHKNAIEKAFLPLSLIYDNELLLQIKFIVNNKETFDDKLSFIPPIISCEFNQAFFYENIKLFEKYGLRDEIEDLKKILFQESYYNNEKFGYIDIFKKRIIIYLFLFVLKKDYHFTGTEVDNLIKDIKKTKANFLISDIIVKHIRKWDGITVYPIVKQIQDLIININDEFDNYKYCNLHYENVTFEITNKLYSTLKKIYSIWQDENFIFRFDWHGISAGEASLLNILSRAYNISSRIESKTIWLLIDEGDIYLHPEWQRTLFFDLHKYFSIFFKDKSIQLLITSHSPFLVSDLPNDNIILLEKDKQTRGCKVVDNSNISNGFGANIHNLLANSFFMKDSFMGEFAKQKIEEVILFLNFSKQYIEYLSFINEHTSDYLENSDELNYSKIELKKLIKKLTNNSIEITNKELSIVFAENGISPNKYKDIINIIGEPIIKNKLTDMYNDVFEKSSGSSEKKKQLEKLAQELGAEIKYKK